MEIYQYEAPKENELERNWARTGIIEFESPGDVFSSSLSLSADGRRLIVGRVQGTSLDQIQVYTFMSNERILREQVTGKNEFSPSVEEFGKSVAISYNGRYIAGGAPEASIGDGSSGYVWIYELLVV